MAIRAPDGANKWKYNFSAKCAIRTHQLCLRRWSWPGRRSPSSCWPSSLPACSGIELQANKSFLSLFDISWLAMMQTWKCSKLSKTRSWWGRAHSSIPRSLTSESSCLSSLPYHHPGDFQYKGPVTIWLQTVIIFNQVVSLKRFPNYEKIDWKWWSVLPWNTHP